MNQTTAAATTTNTHPVDLEALRLQLEENRKVYWDNPDSNEAHERLLHTLQSNDCREIITAVVDEDDLADAFALTAERNDIDILEAFLNHGMNVDIKHKDGFTALMYATYYRLEQCVRFLLDRNSSVNVQNNSGMTAMMFASQFDKANLVQMMLEKNANPDIQDNNGMTALMIASMKGHKEIVQLLLNHGADVDLKDKNGKTLRDLARNDAIKEMIQNHVPTTYLLK